MQRPAISYVRFSSRKQERGDSQRRQETETLALCRDFDLNLDSSLCFRDLGVSAFRGKNAETGALGAFLTLAEEGKLPKNSVFIVESIDRISRAKVLKALSIFTRILECGVEIITLMDRKRYTQDSVNNNPTDLMFSILIMMRANEESMAKSNRLSASWAKKRVEAAKGQRAAICPRCPGWLRYDARERKFVVVPDRVKVMRQIVEWSIDGIGCRLICSRLKAAGIPSFSDRRNPDPKSAKKNWNVMQWCVGGVKKLISNRALIGHFQPSKYVEGKKTPDGPMLENYFPPIITESEWYKLRAAIKSRGPGKRGNEHDGKVPNLFGRCMKNGRDGSNMQLAARFHKAASGDKKIRYHYLQSAAYNSRQAPCQPTFPYAEFEWAFLHWIREIDLHTLDRRELTIDQVAIVEGKLADTRATIESIEAQILAGGGNSKRLATILDRLGEQETNQERDLEAAKAKKQAQGVGDLNEILQKLESATGDELNDLRARIRGRIQSACTITYFPYGRRLRRLAMAYVKFGDGSRAGETLLVVRAKRGTETWAMATSEIPPCSRDKLAARLLDAKTRTELAIALGEGVPMPRYRPFIFSARRPSDWSDKVA